MDAAKANHLRTSVREVYSTIANEPHASHPFTTGRPLARDVGYPDPQLNQLPASAIESFAGVAALSLFATLAAGTTVLDLGCGAGLDSLIAAQKVGENGHVVGVDFSSDMVALARQNALAVGLRNVSFVNGDAEHLPLPNGVIDTALVNGIFNLNPARTAIFAELARVVRVGGSFYAAEIVLRHRLSAETIANETNWFA